MDSGQVLLLFFLHVLHPPHLHLLRHDEYSNHTKPADWDNHLHLLLHLLELVLRIPDTSTGK